MKIADRLKGLRDYFNENIKPLMAAAPAAAPAAVAAPAAAAAAPTEYTLADGITKVLIDKLEPGGIITPTPAAEGSITLQDGTVITYDATGIITLVTAKAAEAVEAPTEMKTAEQMQAFLSQFADDVTANTSGMGAPDLNKLAIVVKALFEDRFGWELRRAKEEADRASAIEIYKAGFMAQGEALRQAIEMIGELSEKAPEPTEKQDSKAWEEMTSLEKFRASKQK